MVLRNSNWVNMHIAENFLIINFFYTLICFKHLLNQYFLDINFQGFLVKIINNLLF